MPNELPLNWCECCIKDIANIQTGKLDANAAVENGNYPFFTCALEPLRINTFSFDGNCIYLPGNGANVGYVGYYQGKFDAYQRTYVLDKIAINERYLYFSILLNWKNYNKDKQFGVATNFIRLGNLENYPINLPPLAEQERIVEKIEALFQDIDEGVERLKSAQAQIKQYRQSVLKSAFEGKLTEKWRKANSQRKQNIKSDITLYTIPETWVWCKLPDIGELNRGKSKHRPRDDEKLYGGKYPFIQTGDIKKANKYIAEYHQTYSEFGLSQSKLWDEDTLCITIAANIAETAILKIKACFPDSVVGFIKNEHLYAVELVEYYIRTIKNTLEKYAPATAQKNINLSTLSDILFPLPPLDEQRQLLEEIEKRFAVADELEKAVNEGLEKADKLKQSILKKAFEGKLVAQNPNDEPASVLLARIKKEKQTLSKTKGKKIYKY